MTRWQKPMYPEKGDCRVKLHGSKLWQAGYILIDWQNVNVAVVKNKSTGTHLAIGADSVEVKE